MMNKKIYQVGGSVRDMILDIPSNDIDYVAVGYVVDDFSDFECVGKDFPVFLDKNGCEIALARTEKKISSGYNGFETNTSDITIEEDLLRRDLSINSIAYDKQSNTFIDPYGGIEDIKNKILRHTSNAFKEDPLRVLRLARFQARFHDFIISSETKIYVKSMKNELKCLQANRVYKEIKKVFELEKSELFFETLLELDVLDILFPNIYNMSLCNENNIYHKEKNLFVHTMMVLKELSVNSNLLKATALYHDIAKPLMYKKSDFKNAGGHDNPKFVEPLLDMELPIKLKKKMLFLIMNHIKIYSLEKMKKTTIATFFEGYNKNRDLFQDQLIFAKADNHGRIGIIKEDIDDNKLLKIFDEITLYSPLNWINKQKNNPSGESIKLHIHNVNTDIVSRLY